MPKIEEDEKLKITRLFVPKYTGGPRPKMVLFRVWPWAVHGRYGAYSQAQRYIRETKSQHIKED